jgi:hypothetical protein
MRSACDRTPTTLTTVCRPAGWLPHPASSPIDGSDNTTATTRQTGELQSDEAVCCLVPAVALHQLQVVSELVLGPRNRISLVHSGDGTAGGFWTRPRGRPVVAAGRAAGLISRR